MNEPNEVIKAAASLMQMSGAELLAVLRRDWAVRVLDACADANGSAISPYPQRNYLSRLEHRFTLWLEGKPYRAATRDAAREAAAEAVFPTLDDATRAKLGEKP